MSHQVGTPVRHQTYSKQSFLKHPNGGLTLVPWTETREIRLLKLQVPQQVRICQSQNPHLPAGNNETSQLVQETHLDAGHLLLPCEFTKEYIMSWLKLS